MVSLLQFMNLSRFKLVLVALLVLLSPLVFRFSVNAQSLEEIQKKIEEYQSQIQKLQAQAQTLSAQINQFNAQIILTQLRIEETEERIRLLSGRIDEIEVSLDALTEAFAQRAVETYKMARVGDPVMFVVSSDNLSEAVSRFHYLQKIQEADRNLLLRLQEAQSTYQEDKQKQEELAQQLGEQRQELANQKAAKDYLLKVTRNDEKRYQQLLAAARAEYEAIQAIIAGRGQEEEIGSINQGDRIASIIQGPSCNSSGSHLHFIVRDGTSAVNPFNHLKSGVDYENCSGSSCGSSDGDPFNPGGDWNWPISPKITFSQGFGSTWAVRNTWVGQIYQFHNGIDINSPSSDVRAVRSGTLYRGSYSGSAGCRLRYVRVDHQDSNLDTLYLHINY